MFVMPELLESHVRSVSPSPVTSAANGMTESNLVPEKSVWSGVVAGNPP